MKYNWAKRVILVDYDGVMTDFTQSFDLAMHDFGYEVVRDDYYSLLDRYDTNEDTIMDVLKWYVHSDEMRHLPPLYDSMKYVRDLRERGYLFHCITSVPQEQYDNRMSNAVDLYGPGVFQRLHCVGLVHDKSSFLAKYAGTGCVWIEDKPENAVMGLDYGLRPVIMDHQYNRNFDHPHVYRAKNWHDARNYILTLETQDEF